MVRRRMNNFPQKSASFYSLWETQDFDPPAFYSFNTQVSLLICSASTFLYSYTKEIFSWLYSVLRSKSRIMQGMDNSSFFGSHIQYFTSLTIIYLSTSYFWQWHFFISFLKAKFSLQYFFRCWILIFTMSLNGKNLNIFYNNTGLVFMFVRGEELLSNFGFRPNRTIAKSRRILEQRCRRNRQNNRQTDE